MGALGFGCSGTIQASASIVSIEDIPSDQRKSILLLKDQYLIRMVWSDRNVYDRTFRW